MPWSQLIAVFFNNSSIFKAVFVTFWQISTIKSMLIIYEAWIWIFMFHMGEHNNTMAYYK